ncbi:unnamed protein product [Heterobilharzia americana]|nr:unnamed protein product [Heterobilharzia americana]
MCIIQIFLTIFLQALVQSIEALRDYFFGDKWINYVFSSVSLALTVALTMIRNLRYLQPYNYLILMMIAAANIIGISTQFVVFALRLFGSQMLQGTRHFTFEIQEYTGNFVSLDVNMLLVCWISHEFCDYSYLIVIGNGVE